MGSNEESIASNSLVKEQFIPNNATKITLEIHSDNPDENSCTGHSWIEANYIDREGQEITKTIGTYPSNPELHYDHELNDNRQSDFSRITELNSDQIAELNETVEQYQSLGNDAWELLKPCSHFASDVWNQVTNEDLEDRTSLGISLPSTLSDSIQKVNNEELDGTLQSPHLEQQNYPSPDANTGEAYELYEGSWLAESAIDYYEDEKLQKIFPMTEQPSEEADIFIDHELDAVDENYDRGASLPFESIDNDSEFFEQAFDEPFESFELDNVAYLEEVTDFGSTSSLEFQTTSDTFSSPESETVSFATPSFESSSSSYESTSSGESGGLSEADYRGEY